MVDQTPTPPTSMPPLGSTPPATPAASTTPPPPPPPPPPPRPAAAPAASIAVEPAPVTASPDAGGPRKSLVGALIAVLIVGLIGGLVILMGSDDDKSAPDTDAVAPAVTESFSASTTVAPAPVTSVVQPAAAVPITAASTIAPATTAPASAVAPPTTLAGPSYPTLPDGSPEPLIAIYDGQTIRVSGWVPSKEKGEQLRALALANSADPTAHVEGELQIDPSVPLNIGARVIEMNSPRFPAGSSEVSMEHGAQLDRVASVLSLLPNVTVTVVGHADQLGDAASNYALSEARAVSVVRYLVGKGIDPARLSSRAVGEQDLLSEEESEASLALNRRTEFVFYGLLAD